MQFRPVKQINTILRQQYFEPTISWSLRVVLALNVPLIVIPLYKGFSFEVIWAAFGAYMLSLIDYRGLHYKKIIIQSITTVLVFMSALAGMWVTHSVWWSVLVMFLVGMCVAIIRNWRDYGPSIAVSAGFFFLFGLAVPVSLELSLSYASYLLVGCAWAIIITLMSFPFQPSNPVRRSVAKIWKANTDLMDVMILKLTQDEKVSLTDITEKELAVRNLINQSRELFANRENKKTRVKTHHYDQLIELRKTASLFAASLSAIEEELEMLNHDDFQKHQDISFYKTLSAFAQASASLSIVVFTFRSDDFSLAKIRVNRCEVAMGVFVESIKDFKAGEREKQAIRHLTESLYQALYYLQLSIAQVETKQNIPKSDYLENYKLTFHEFVSGLKPAAFTDFVSELFQVNPQQFKYALRVALGLALGVFIFKFFNIDHGYWIPLTMMIVIQPYYGATLKKGLERIVGTVAGIVLGGAIMLLPMPREVYVGILVIDSFCVAYFLRNNYKVGVFFVTIMMVLLMQISQLGTWQLIGWRVISTLIGAMLALAAGYAFWPDWEKRRFPALFENSLIENKKYLRSVISSMQKTAAPLESWHRRRRLAEGANNEVFASAQRMLQEPEYARQQVDRNFALVGANLRITREITSVALNLEKHKMTISADALEDFLNKTSVVIHLLINRLVLNEEVGTVGLFLELKASLNKLALVKNEQLGFVKTELEKIIFELEAMDVLLSSGDTGTDNA